jgi:hypothetical protein
VVAVVQDSAATAGNSVHGSRKPRTERRSNRMRVAAEQSRLTARTVTASAPSRLGGERERELSRAAGHRQQDHTKK